MNRKIRVLHIIPSFASGGAERVLLGYLKDFKDDKDIELYALALGSDRNSIYDKEIERLHLNVIYADIQSMSIYNTVEILRKIRKTVKKIKPDILHSHLRLVPYVTFATLFHSNIKRIHTIHTVPAIASAGKIKNLDRFCFKFMKVLPICLNKELAKEAEQLYNIPFCEFLYNGIDIDKYKGFQGKDAMRKALGIPQDAFLVGHVGRFVPIKNHKFLIDVFLEVYKKNKNSYLLLIGEGPEMEKIKEKCRDLAIENNVIFCGARTDVNELLQIMDAYIFPSIQEGLGISLIEAQAAGLRCVVSDTIPREAFVCDKIFPMPLSASPTEWCDVLLGTEKSNVGFQDIKNFSISEVNNKLKNIYMYGKEGINA